MNSKKPLTYKDISDSGAKPKSSTDAVKRIVDSLESRKGDILTDQKFLENLIRHCVDSPDSFTREIPGEPKVERHSLRGRTNKSKLVIWLSDVEKEQLQALVRQRGDRSPSDLVNHLVCLALGALRSI